MLFCSYCGHKILLNDENKHTIHYIDDAAIKRAIQLYQKAINDLYTSFEKYNDTYEFAITLNREKEKIRNVKICALTNGLVKPIPLKNLTVGNADISFDIWNIDRLYRCVTSGKMRETIEIDFENEFGLTIPCIENNTSDKYSVYLAIVSGNLLASLYDKHRDRLLEKNVRSFLQVKGAVNKGIRDTLREEPDMFLAYNNGISVTAESVEIVRDDNGKPSIKKIRDMQVRPMEEMEQFVKENNIDIAVLTIPKNSARTVAEKLVRNGIRGIWNFAHVDLNVPKEIQVENVHLSDSLMKLTYNINRFEQESPGC